MPDSLDHIVATRRPAPRFSLGDRVLSVTARDTSAAFTIARIDWVEPHAGRPGFWCVSGGVGGCVSMGSEKLYRSVAASDPEAVAESSYRHLFWPHGNSFEGRR